MLRTSTNNKEKIRVSKKASKYSFNQIGSAYIKAYKQIPFVKKVKIIFIVGYDELFEELNNIAKQKTRITQTIDHILKGMVLNDCDACSVKDLCGQVEGLREIHKGG